MADLTDIITTAVEHATDTGEVLSAVESADGETSADAATPEVPAADSAAGGGEGSGPAAATEPVAAAGDADDAEITRLLEESGIRAPQPGKDNRIPYSRVVKIIGNGLKKRLGAIKGEHEKAIAEREKAVSAAKAELAEYAKLDGLIRTDQPRYLEALAAVTGIDTFRQAAAAIRAGAKPEAKPDTDPEPLPDQQAQDGTKYYSDEQFGKWRQWQVRQATNAAKAELEKEYGPVLQRSRALAARDAFVRQNIGKVRDRAERIRQSWGAELFDAHKAEIEAALAKEQQAAQLEHRPAAEAQDIVASVLVPKLSERANKQREAVIAEMKQVPAAATRTKGQATKPVTAPDPNEVRDLEDVIREASREAGLIQ